MNNYIDKYGHYHLKPVGPDGLPPTNDGWIMTAYAVKLGLPVDNDLIGITYSQCRVYHTSRRRYILRRSPGQDLPPASRDSIIGVAFIFPEFLSTVIRLDNWCFSPWDIPKFNLIQTIKSVILCLKAMKTSKKPRNEVWNYPHLYRFAFSVPLVDRHVILKWGGLRSNLLYWLAYQIDKRRKTDSESSKFIKWLKYNHELTKEDWVHRFGEEHPFSEKVKLCK